MNKVTIYSFDVFLSLFGTSLLFHVWFLLLLPDLHTGFSRGRSGDLVLPSLSEFSTICCDPHSKDFGIVNKAKVDVFLEPSCFFEYPADVGNLISGSSAFSKTSLNICKFIWNMPAHLENSAVATGLEKISFHSNPKERQCQRMFKLLHNCTHLTCQQNNAQNSPSLETVCEP